MSIFSGFCFSFFFFFFFYLNLFHLLLNFPADVFSFLSDLQRVVLANPLCFLPLQILSEWFGRSVIRSCVKLSYDHAQSMIEAPEKLFSADELPPCAPEHPIDEIHRAVLNLHSIAKELRAQRFGGGALRLDQVGRTS